MAADVPVKEKRDKPRSAWSRMHRLVGDKVGTILALAVASILAGLAEAGILSIAAQAATSIVNRTSRIHLRLGPVNLHTTVGTLLIVAIGLAVVRILLQVAASYYPAVIGGDAQARMRRDLFSAYTEASWDLQSQDQEGHFQEMMTNQVALASAGAFQAAILLTFMFTFLVLAASAFALNVVAAATVLGAATLLFAGFRPLTLLGQKMARRLSAAQINYAGAVGEATSIAEETQVFGIAGPQRTRIDGFIGPSRRLFVRTQMIGRVVPNLYQGMIYVILIIGLLIIDLAHAGGFSSLGAVVLLLVRAGAYGQQAQGAYQYLRQALPYIERVQDTTDRYRASGRTRGTVRMGPVRTLALEGVSYSYRPDRPVLSGLTCAVTGGETIGVVGPSGAGKSTLVQILLRLRPPNAGRYLINGVPAEEYDSVDWTRRVGYVPQQPRLVYASVADNVRFFRPIDDEAVERACRLARIHDEIMTWAHGYDTIVGPRADAVSGGQQQRICLARALAAEPELLVLDEPTSALDPRSEALIQESLVAVKKNLTLFIIAHRMSTLNICDRVMVILDGKLDAFDTLESLRRSNEYYRFASSLSAGTPQPASSSEPKHSPRVTEDVIRGAGRWWWSRRGDRS